MKEVTTTRLVLDKEEREIRKSWGRDWARLRNDAKKYGTCFLLMGDWSGYNSSQYRLTHCTRISKDEADTIKLRTVRFSDNTTMSVWIVKTTIEQLLNKRWKAAHGYDSLLSQAIKTGDVSYSV